MDPKLAFWTAALINLCVIASLIAIGIRAIRRRQLALHRRCLTTAAALVVGFLGVYPLKLLWLGPEPIGEWSGTDVLVLRIHEACVFAMVVGGLVAWSYSRKMHRDRNRWAQLPDAPLASSRTLRRHRRAGWTAAIGAGLALLTAAIVLVGMVERTAAR